jgi:hypothetical protein
MRSTYKGTPATLGNVAEYGDGLTVHCERRTCQHAAALDVAALIAKLGLETTVPDLVDVSFNTVNKLLIDAGLACARFHDENVRGVQTEAVPHDAHAQRQLGTAIAGGIEKSSNPTAPWTAHGLIHAIFESPGEKSP